MTTMAMMMETMMSGTLKKQTKRQKMHGLTTITPHLKTASPVAGAYRQAVGDILLAVEGVNREAHVALWVEESSMEDKARDGETLVEIDVTD